MAASNTNRMDARERLQELREEATDKARAMQKNATRRAELLVGRAREQGLGAVLATGADALDGAAKVSGKLGFAKGLSEKLKARASALAEAREDLHRPPIENYDELNVHRVAEELEGLDAWQLAKVREYEETHKNRKTVLAAIDRR